LNGSIYFKLGSFTVFAPTDEAFASIDSQTLKYILDNVELLKDILTYHVVAFEISPAFLSSIKHVYQFPTVQGAAPIRINVYREQGSITPFDTIKVIKLSEK
jgi:transforming growth factor-beta-induced protein